MLREGRLTVLVVVMLTLVTGACESPGPSAQSSGSPTPAPVSSVAPLSDAPLNASTAADLQAVLDDYLAAHDTASVSAAVIVPGVGTWSGVAGQADTAAQQAATTDTVYAIGSITKNFVASLTLKLVGDGVLRLDDPASKWLDGPAAAKTNGATIEQLLSHRSGIASFTSNDAILTPGKVWTPAQLLDLVGPPSFAAGAQFEYSNTNYLLLGLIDERAGGSALDVQLRTRLFGPNGLRRTFLSGPEMVAPPLAHGYGSATQLTGDLYDGSGYLPNESLASGAWAAGGMASTPGDIARWFYDLCSGLVLGPDLTGRMLPPAGSSQYGLGIDQQAFPGAGIVTGHVGALPGYVAAGFFKRDSCTVATVMTNGDVDDLVTAMGSLFAVAGPQN